MEAHSTFDTVIVGGALSGAATALQLLQQRPELSIAIIEKSTAHGRRVGEATVELSGHFLGQTLGLASYLNRTHILKQGLRFYHAGAATESLYDCTEIGPVYNVRLPSYQVDRAILDEEVLRRAVAAGATLIRPAKVGQIKLEAGGTQHISYRDEADTPRTLQARWVIDATGQASLLGRKQNLLRRNERHPIASVWARFTGVLDWDDPAHRQHDADWSKRVHVSRNTATNHFIGDGYWIWCIPLASGEYSLGVVYDMRMVDFPKDGPLCERLLDFLRQHPAARTLLKNARPVDGDTHARSRLAYYAEQLMGDGWALVGDAAGFIDPFYSPGMDWIAFTTGSTATLIAAQHGKDALPTRIEAHNAAFRKSYQRWFEAIYENKYRYLGDAELLDLAFRFDLGTYYLGVVQPLLKAKQPHWEQPPFSHPHATFPYHLIRTFNRRMAAIADARRRRGTFGRDNHRQWRPFMSYPLNWTLPARVALLMLRWLKLELREGWRSWFKPQLKPVPGATLHDYQQRSADS